MKISIIKNVIFFFIFICILIFYFCLSFENKGINYDESKIYKYEIQETVNKTFREKIKEIDKISAKADLMYENYQNNPFNLDLYNKFEENRFDKQIETVEIDFYSDLIDITRYHKLIKKEDLSQMNYSCQLYEFLLPYFIENKINTTKIRKFFEYATIKKKKITDCYHNEKTQISIPKAYLSGYLKHCRHFNNPEVMEYIKKHPKGTFGDKIKRYIYYNFPIPLNVCLFAKFHGYDYVVRTQFSGESVVWKYKGKYSIYHPGNFSEPLVNRYILVNSFKIRFDEGNEYKEIHNCYPQPD